MAIVHIPAAMRPTTGGNAVVEVAGATLGEVLDNLEAAHPGLRARLFDGDRVRRNLAILVDGVQTSARLRAPVRSDSEVYIVPAIAGG